MTKRYYVGTAIKITSIVSPVPPDSIFCTIKDPGGTIVSNMNPMTQENTDVYSFIYQSNVNDIYGKYTVVITANSGAYSTVSILEIELEEQPGLLR